MRKLNPSLFFLHRKHVTFAKFAKYDMIDRKVRFITLESKQMVTPNPSEQVVEKITLDLPTQNLKQRPFPKTVRFVAFLVAIPVIAIVVSLVPLLDFKAGGSSFLVLFWILLLSYIFGKDISRIYKLRVAGDSYSRSRAFALTYLAPRLHQEGFRLSVSQLITLSEGNPVRVDVGNVKNIELLELNQDQLICYKA